MNTVSTASKRSLGAFYTPASLSDLLCTWGIRHSSDVIFEPSFGGCGFLRSAVERLRLIGNLEPHQQLYGCDIDPEAFVYLSKTLEQRSTDGHFVEGDYLNVASESWPIKFDLIIGNPPYLPYQKINSQARQGAKARLARQGLELGQRASLWAYFVGLSLENLALGGRIAWVLPGSFLQADYARRLRRYLASRFERIRAFAVQERLFLDEGTDEETVVLLADGHRADTACVSPADIGLTICADLAALATHIQLWDRGDLLPASDCAAAVAGQISNRAKQLLSVIGDLEECHYLGDFVKVRIGLVTGDNPFFLLTRGNALDLQIPEAELTPVLSKFAYFDGLSFDDVDHEKLLAAGGRALMVNCGETGNGEALQRYIDTYSKEKIRSIGTYGKRNCWTKPEDGNIPPAFFPVMHHLGPRLILNRTSSNCTNTLHRAFFGEGVDSTKAKLLSISLLCTFSQISGEIVGRKYGSGVLKHEPRDAERIRVLLPDVETTLVDKTFSEIDKLLREGDADGARLRADDLILSGLRFLRDKEWRDCLPQELLAIRERRVPNRKRKALHSQ